MQATSELLTYASKVESQYIKFRTKLILFVNRFQRVVDCCYSVIHFLAETTKTKQIHDNSKPKPNQTSENHSAHP